MTTPKIDLDSLVNVNPPDLEEGLVIIARNGCDDCLVPGQEYTVRQDSNGRYFVQSSCGPLYLHEPVDGWRSIRDFGLPPKPATA